MTERATTIISGSEIENTVREYISRQFLADFGADLTDETDLFVAGVVDSFGFAELVLFLETTFAVQFEGEELTADHLNSVANIASTIRKKSGAN